MPCGRLWNPDAPKLGRWWIAYVTGFLLLTWSVPQTELLLIGHPRAAAIFAASVVLAALLLRWQSLRRPRIAEPDTSGFTPGDILSLN